MLMMNNYSYIALYPAIHHRTLHTVITPDHWNQARTPTKPESRLYSSPKAHGILRFLTGSQLAYGWREAIR